MSGLFAGTPLERPVTCEVCGAPLDACVCPRDAAGVVRRPQDQTAVVGRERRRHGRVVTTVRGLEPVASDLPAILKKLRAACAAGGTIAEGVLEVQGDHRDEVRAALEAMAYRVEVPS